MTWWPMCNASVGSFVLHSTIILVTYEYISATLAVTQWSSKFIVKFLAVASDCYYKAVCKPTTMDVVSCAVLYIKEVWSGNSSDNWRRNESCIERCYHDLVNQTKILHLWPHGDHYILFPKKQSTWFSKNKHFQWI